MGEISPPLKVSVVIQDLGEDEESEGIGAKQEDGGRSLHSDFFVITLLLIFPTKSIVRQEWHIRQTVVVQSCAP